MLNCHTDITPLIINVSKFTTLVGSTDHCSSNNLFSPTFMNRHSTLTRSGALRACGVPQHDATPTSEMDDIPNALSLLSSMSLAEGDEAEFDMVIQHHHSESTIHTPKFDALTPYSTSHLDAHRPIHTNAYARDMVDQYCRHLFGEESTRYLLIRTAISCHRVLFLFDCDDGVQLDTLVESCIISLASQFYPLMLTCRQEVVRDTDLIHSQLFQLYELQHLNQMQQRAIILARLGQKNSVHFRSFLNLFHEKLGGENIGEDAVLLRSPTMLSMLLCYWQRESQKDDGSVHYSKRPGSTATLDVSLSEVFRVATDVMVTRVQEKHRAHRHQAKLRQRHFMDALQYIAFYLQHMRRVSFFDHEPVAWLPQHLRPVWSDLRSAINAGQVALVSASSDGAGAIRMRFVFYSYQKYLAACSIVDDTCDAHRFTMKEIIADSWWSEVMEVLVAKWPNRYQKLVTPLLYNDAEEQEIGEPYIHFAARNNHYPLFHVLKDLPTDICRKMHLPNADSLTALHIAAQNGTVQICSSLLSVRADVTATTKNGWIPLFFAVSHLHVGARTVLLEAFRERKAHERNRAYSKLRSVGLELAKRILAGEIMSDEKFVEKVQLYCPELSYFSGRSDATPDATALSLQLTPVEIEYRRTLGAMLSVYWICTNQREQFIRVQDPCNILSTESWDAIQEWARNGVGLKEPPAICAIFNLMAIHDLGKLADFRKVLPQEIYDHDEAISRIVNEYPEILPSYMSLDKEHQAPVSASVQTKFNFGQFLQAENLPVNLSPVKEVLGRQGPAALAFYLFHIFADMCGIMGAQTLEGSKFMTETMYQNFCLGRDVLQELTRSSPAEVYDEFLRRRASGQGLEICTPMDRAVVRLACMCRCFDTASGALVRGEFASLPDIERDHLAAFLNATGIDSRPAFLLYYAPAFLENAIENQHVGLRRALLLMLKVYELATKNFLYANSNIVVHVGELATWSAACVSAVHFENTCIQMIRDNVRCESKVVISPWCQYSAKLDYARTATATLNSWLAPGTVDAHDVVIRKLVAMYPELSYYGTLDLPTEQRNDSDNQVLSKLSCCVARLLSSILSMLWLLCGEYERFVKCQTLEKAKHTMVLTEAAFGQLRAWFRRVARLEKEEEDETLSEYLEFVDASIVFLILTYLPKIKVFCEDFSPTEDPFASEDGDILAAAIRRKTASFPSFKRLSTKYKQWIRDAVTINFSFNSFMSAQAVPSMLQPLLSCMSERPHWNFTLFHFCCKSLGRLGHKTLDGCLFFDQQTATAALCAIQALNDTGPADGRYRAFLRAVALPQGGLLFADEREKRAVFRITCMASAGNDDPARGCSQANRKQETEDSGAVIAEPATGLLCSKVRDAFYTLEAKERANLVDYMNRSGDEFATTFVLHGATKLFELAMENPMVGLTCAIRLLVHIFDSAEREYASASVPLIIVRTKELASFVQSYRATVPFDGLHLDIFRHGARGSRECSAHARAWMQVRDPLVLSQLKTAGLELASKVLSGLLTERQFIEDAKRVFPELNYFRGGTADSTVDASASVNLHSASIEYRRTLGAMLSVYWVLADMHKQFVRGQPEDDRLSKESWENLQYWTRKVVALTSPTMVDTMLCFMSLHDLGKMTHLRLDLAPGIQDHDEALDFILEEHPDVFPSFQRLDPENQALIRASANVKFNFGQFLQAENLPANLVALKDLTKESDNALGFYLFHIFADMSGILGAKTLEGSVFMTETMYGNFKRGLDVLQTLSSNTVEDSYDTFLQRRSTLCFFSFDDDEKRALVRLACCARVFTQEGGQLVASAFRSLFSDERKRLVKHLNADGVGERPGFLLYYEPAFLENCKNSAVVGLARGMRMLLNVYDVAAREYTDTLEPVVTVFIDTLAREVKDCDSSLTFDNISFHLKRSADSRGDVEAIAVVDREATKRAAERVREALRMRIPFQFQYFDLYDVEKLTVAEGEVASDTIVPDLSTFFESHTANVGLQCTTSCFYLWDRGGKKNKFGKVIPVFEPRIDYNVFFFDDNLDLDGGKADDRGICNLRLIDGTYIDFSLDGPHGFLREQVGPNTYAQYSREYSIVLVKVCILDALEDEQYFINIVRRFSKPWERVIIHMDLNGTVVLGDVMSAKNAEMVLLTTLFEYIHVEIGDASRGESLKEIVRRLVPRTEYLQFWKGPEPWNFLETQCTQGLKLRFQNKNVTPRDVERLHHKNMKRLNLTSRGICRSWLELVRQFREQALIMINSFGVDSRQVLRVTLEKAVGEVDTGDISMSVVNFNDWNANDRKQFHDYFVDIAEGTHTHGRSSASCGDLADPERR